MNYKLVSDFNSIDTNQWNRFIENHPKGNIFQTSIMFDVYRNSKKYDPLIIVVFNIDHAIVGLQISVVVIEAWPNIS